jgi:RNA polymerase sigma-32 factor
MLQRLDARDVSLDTRTFDESQARRVDRLTASENQEHALFEHEFSRGVKGVVAHAISELNARERFIVEHRLMADPAEELSLAEIGRKLGVSRERARQLEARIKVKLRARILDLGSATVGELFDVGEAISVSAAAS